MFADFAFLPSAVTDEFAADLKSKSDARHRWLGLKVFTCFFNLICDAKVYRHRWCNRVILYPAGATTWDLRWT